VRRSLERTVISGVVHVMRLGDSTPAAAMARRQEPGRGQRARHRSMRISPGTWEALLSPLKKTPVGSRQTKRSRLAARGRPQAVGANAQAVPPGEGNRVRRDGWQGIREPHSTGEAGEPSLTGPGGGKGAPVVRTPRRERCRDHRISVASQRDSDG